MPEIDTALATGAVLPALKVTVSPPLPVNVPLHGFVVPVQVDGLRLDERRQPAKVDPPAAVAVNVTEAALAEVVILGEHVLVTVCEDAAAPVPPQETGALTVPVFGVIVTEPLPLPENVRIQFRASVKSVVAVPETSPVATT